jgi:hypothetical protein
MTCQGGFRCVMSIAEQCARQGHQKTAPRNGQQPGSPCNRLSATVKDDADRREPEGAL